MAHARRFAIVGLVCLVAGVTLTSSTTLEEDFIARPNWCPGNGCTGANIQAQHQTWHVNFSGGRDFVEYHRELLARISEFRLYGSDAAGPDPDPAVFPVDAVPGSLLEFAHTSVLSNSFNRPALHQIDAPPLAHTDPGGTQRSWPVRPASLRLGNATFCGYTAPQMGSALDGMYHGNGHMSIAGHDSPPGAGDMASTNTATRDGAFFQWHKHNDEIAVDWAVSKYQLCDKSGVPIYFSVGPAAVGTAGSSLTERRGSNVYQGNTVVNPATQYGAIPRIPSDIYVADNDSKNLLYAYGVLQWNTVNAWDIDAWSILNPAGSGFYFSVSMGSSGAPATAVAGQAVRGGDVFESSGGGVNALYRAETALGLAAAATDELDALELDFQRRVQGTNDDNDAGVYNRPKQFFSLRSGSTFGVQSTSGVAIDDSDILRFGPKGELLIAVAGTVLGLVPADDLDALAIVDVDASETLTATDKIYYSLAAGSPSGAPADIFCKTVAGVNCGGLGGNLEMTAASLGLLATDELDALDIKGPAATTGACCRTDGTCSDVTAASCTSLSGTFAGLGTVCSATQCPCAPGACCSPTGSCSQTSDQACLALGGTFRGAGVSCELANCPSTPNDECSNAYAIPYDRPSYYEPPAQYEDNTYAYTSPTDPPYSCADHGVFFPPYGSGTIWYYYDVPVGPGTKRSIVLDTYQTGPTYPYGGGAGDTRLSIYYSSSGNCSTLQEVACGDNRPGAYTTANYYAATRYDDPAPGRYYIQLSTVGDANRGAIRLAVTDTTNVPTLSAWAIVVLSLLLTASIVILLRRRSKLSLALFVLWVAGLALAVGAMSACRSTSRVELPAPIATWPTASRLARDAELSTLIMFAHPRCACTKSSLTELRELMPRVEGKVHGYVLFAHPEGEPMESSRTDTWISAESIQGLTVLGDEAAREAELFGATTSGQVMLFDPGGRLRFSGGIAPLRGQIGDSPMLRGLLATIESTPEATTKVARVQMPGAVFGCALRAERNDVVAR